MPRFFVLALMSVALVAAAEPAVEPTLTDDAVLTTKWTLKKAPAKPVAGQRRIAGAGSAKASDVNAKKVRVFGGATVSNTRNRKTHGQVGVALPF